MAMVGGLGSRCSVWAGVTSAVGSRGTLAGSTCIGDGGLTAGATGVAGLAAGATVG